MGRRYDDVVDVRTGPSTAGPLATGPTAFVWQERLYVVREVLGHWHEREAWWQAPEGRRLTGASGEQEVLRVAASAGRTRGTGTYDLGRSPTTSGDRDAQAWRLLEVVD